MSITNCFGFCKTDAAAATAQTTAKKDAKASSCNLTTLAAKTVALAVLSGAYFFDYLAPVANAATVAFAALKAAVVAHPYVAIAAVVVGLAVATFLFCGCPEASKDGNKPKQAPVAPNNNNNNNNILPTSSTANEITQ